jgi:hypothetical protein
METRISPTHAVFFRPGKCGGKLNLKDFAEYYMTLGTNKLIENLFGHVEISKYMEELTNTNDNVNEVVNPILRNYM